MFKKSYVYHFKATTSALPNNLFAISESNELICGLGHKNSICLIIGSELTNMSFRHILCDNDSSTSNNVIISMGIIYLNKKPVLGILKEDSLSIYEPNGSAIICCIESKMIDPVYVFCCFSALTGSHVLIGTDNGFFLKFELLKDENVQFKENIKAHNGCVLCVNADEKWLASADDNSTINFWKITADSSLDLVSKYAPTVSATMHLPSTILMINEKRVCAAGFTNGRLYLFNCETGRLLGEIGAHSKIITGLAFKLDVLISVSEDTICRVWHVKSRSDSTGDDKPSASVTLIQSIIVADQMLQGVSFTNRKQMEFVISSYDSNEILSFVQA